MPLLLNMLLLMLAAVPVTASAQAAQANDVPTYADVAPILSERCVMCHTGPAAPLGLQLDSYEAVIKGGTNRAVVVAGDADGSELVRRIRGTSQPRMPMTGPPFLDDAQVELIARWVEAGMPKGDGNEGEAGAPPTEVKLPVPGDAVTYSDVAPILARRCAKCHTENGLMGPAPEGYLLTSYDAALSSSDRVRIVPGQADASELVRRIRGQSRPRMPFDGPPWLTPDEIRVIEDWINQGAPNAQGEVAPVPVGARVRLEGRLGAGWRLDGLPLNVGPGTRMDKSPRPGDHVEVRGRLDDSGNVIVERLRRR